MEWIKQNWIILVALQQAGVLVFTSQNDLANKFVYQEQDKSVLVEIQEEIQQGTEIYIFENATENEIQIFFGSEIEDIQEKEGNTYVKFKDSTFIYMFSHDKKTVEKLLSKDLLDYYERNNVIFVKVTGGVDVE